MNNLERLRKDGHSSWRVAGYLDVCFSLEYCFRNGETVAIWSGDFRHWNEKSLVDKPKTARFQEVSVKHETALENIALTKAETGGEASAIDPAESIE